MLFIACSSSDEAANEQGNQLKLSAGITAQKEPYEISKWGTKIELEDIDATTAKVSKFELSDAETRNPVDNNNWAGMANRNLSVQIGSNTPDMSSIDASGNITMANPYYFTTLNNVSLKAWYPYSATLTSFSVQTDQTSYANYEKSDLMYATATVSQSASIGNLTFSHKNAKVIFNVTVTGVNNLYAVTNISAVTLSNVYTKETVSNGAVSSPSTSSSVKMYCSKASYISNNTATATFEACLVPQTTAIKYAINYGSGTYSGTLDSKTLVSGGQYTCNVVLNILAKGTLNGHEWVRLALPSNVKWATMNLGADSISSYGSFYYWGAIKPAPEVLTPWDGMENLSTTNGRDAANLKWGSTWRMPTANEFRELMDNCTSVEGKLNDRRIFYFTSKKNNQVLVINGAGGLYSDGQNSGSERVNYWTSTVIDVRAAYSFNEDDGIGIFSVNNDARTIAEVIRPVTN